MSCHDEPDQKCCECGRPADKLRHGKPYCFMCLFDIIEEEYERLYEEDSARAR